ncbi:MAG: hypothetical protein HUK40_04290 [Desulfobacter sp.]|nr:hypothetical protein [Desulfobacter sp.]
MDKADKKTIQNWTPPGNFNISILTADHPEQERFTRFAKAWTNLNSNITWIPNKRESDLPGFALKENITYSALPLERELAPFLSSLESLGANVLSQEIRQMLDRIELPCELTLYIALQCPHCPAMVKTLIPMAAYCEKIGLHIIDGSLFRQKAETDKVMAAPCLILDKDFRWTEAVPETELISMILNRDPSRLGTSTLKNIIEAGDAEWITKEMIKTGKIFDGFTGLLLHKTWSVRLGAMVVVESLGEQAPDLGLKLAPILMERFEGRDIPIQGDILYALGEIGGLETKAWILQQITHLSHEDLKDAAMDAVDAIESRLAP